MLAILVVVGVPAAAVFLLGTPELALPSEWADARARIDDGTFPAGYVVNIITGGLLIAWIASLWFLLSDLFNRSGNVSDETAAVEEGAADDAGEAEEPWYRQGTPIFDEPFSDEYPRVVVPPDEMIPDDEGQDTLWTMDAMAAGSDAPTGLLSQDPLLEDMVSDAEIIGGAGGASLDEPPMIVPVRAYYFTRAEDTLRSISAQFLHTPRRWQELRSLNAASPGVAAVGPDTLLPTGTALALPGDPLPWGKPDPVYLWTLAEKFLFTAWGREPTPEEVVPFWRGLTSGTQLEAEAPSKTPGHLAPPAAAPPPAPAYEPPAAPPAYESPVPPSHEPPPPAYEPPAAPPAYEPPAAPPAYEPPAAPPAYEPPAAPPAYEPPAAPPAYESPVPPSHEPPPPAYEPPAAPPAYEPPAAPPAYESPVPPSHEPPPPAYEPPAAPPAYEPPAAPPAYESPVPPSHEPPPPAYEPPAAPAAYEPPAAPPAYESPVPPSHEPPPPAYEPPAAPAAYESPVPPSHEPPAYESPVPPTHEPPPPAFEPPPAPPTPGLPDFGPIEPEIPYVETEAPRMPSFMPSLTGAEPAAPAPEAQMVAASNRSLAGTAVGDAMMLWQLSRLRRRRPGAGRDAVDPIEESLKQSARVDSLNLIEAAMRHLRAVTVGRLREKPAVLAVRVGTYGFEVLLNRPAQAPEGWQVAPGGYVLELPQGVTVEDLDSVGQGPTLCPALVPVGDTLEGPLLLNVEEIGCLIVSGPGSPSVNLLNAVVGTLGSSPLAGDIRIITVGLDTPAGLIGWENVHSTSFDSPQLEELLSTAQTGSGASLDVLVVGPGNDLLIQRAGQVATTPGSRLALVGATSSVAARWPWRIHVDETTTAVVHPIACTMAAAQAMAPAMAQLLSEASDPSLLAPPRF